MLRSLRTQVLAGQLLLTALLALVLGLGVYQLAAGILERKEWEKVRLLSQGLARETNQAMVQAETQLERMASGQELERFTDTLNYHLLQALFDKYKGTFTSLAYISPRGIREYAASGPGYTDRDTDLAADQLVADSLNAPARIFSSLRPTPGEEGPRLVMALARRSPLGVNMGALLAAAPLETLARSVLDLRLERGGYAVLADTRGRLLTLPGAPSPPPDAPLTVALAEGRAGVLREVFLGRDSLIGLAPVGSHGLVILVAQPRREAIETDLAGLRLLVVSVTSATALLAGLLALWWSGGVTRPMARLAAAARRVTGGDLSARAPLAGSGEARDLARAFNTMTTALEQSRLQLLRERENLENLLATMNEALVVVDRQGRIAQINRAGQTLLAKPRERLVGRPVADILPPDDPLADFLAAPDTRRLLEKEGLTGLEKALLGPDGRETPVLVSLALLRDRDGQPEGVVCLAMDITERKRVEELARARRAAEAASRAKTEFLAVLSHEMRTPLNIVLGVLEHLLDAPLPGPSRQAVERALRSGHSLCDVITAMLDYAGLEAGRVILRRQVFDPRDLARQVTERLAEAARTKGLALSLEVAPGLPPRLVGDPERLSQALRNLLANAVRFTAVGEARLSLFDLTPDPEAAARRLVVVVSDTGMGVTDAKLEYVFEPFTQEDATSNRRFGGLGLGLAITRRLVSLMGGSLCLYSRPGEGTDVYVALCLDVAGGGAADEPTAAETMSQRPL